MNQRLALKYAKTLNNFIPVQNTQVFKNEIILTVEAKKVKAILLFLRDSINCQYKILSGISGADYPERSKRFEVIYEILSIPYTIFQQFLYYLIK